MHQIGRQIYSRYYWKNSRGRERELQSAGIDVGARQAWICLEVNSESGMEDVGARG